MPRTDVAERQFPQGQTFTAALAVGATALGAKLSLTRTASVEAESTDAAILRVFVSDDEANWALLKTVRFPGGVILGKDGVTPVIDTWFSFTWPGEWNGGVRTAKKSDHVRLDIEALRTFRTAIAIESLEST